MSAPVRLAFVLPHFRPGGAELAVLNWCRALDRERFSPVLILKQRTGAFLDRLPADVEIHDLGGGRALTLAFGLRALLKSLRIDCAYSATNAMNLALAAACPREICAILSEHTSPRAYLAEAKWPLPRRAAMRMLYPRAGALFVPTGDIAVELREIAPRAPHAVVVPNPVIDEDAIGPISPLRTPADGGPLRMVAAGRLVRAKAFDRLIEACAMIGSQGLDFRCDIYGEGPLRPELEAQIEGAGLRDRVSLRGHSDDLPNAIRDADIFVLASRREGFGNVVVEALAVGTPVIATDTPGPAALIGGSGAGRLVSAEDAAALAEAIVQLWHDSAARSAMREAGIPVARNYTIQRSVAAFEGAFRDLWLSQFSTSCARHMAQNPSVSTPRPAESSNGHRL